jgi:hypothetical protein
MWGTMWWTVGGFEVGVLGLKSAKDGMKTYRGSEGTYVSHDAHEDHEEG